ncbi:vacuolar sorting protein 9 (vps9) domain-containing protein [Cryptosporidium felis]|nr:vacuolar sorting protein 9 (vps9) domain-containing protein [Cryptosporidium felis]
MMRTHGGGKGKDAKKRGGWEMRSAEFSDLITGSPNDSGRSEEERVGGEGEIQGLEHGRLEELNAAKAEDGIEGEGRREESDGRERQQSKATAPYSRFLALLKDAKCSEIVFLIARFIQQYPHLDEGMRQLLYGEDGERLELEAEVARGQEEIGTATLAKMLHSFVAFCAELLRETGVFGPGESAGEIDFVTEGLEKLVTTKLYNVLFEAVSFENDEADHYLFKKLKVLRTFVKLDHFDISKVYIETLQEDGLWLDACRNELYKLTKAKSPKDKVVLIVNICKILLSYMSNVNRTRAEKEAFARGEERIHSPPAADDLLPLLIFCIIQSNPSKIKAHLEFISSFRSSQLLVSEDLYFFTHFYSAITFLEKLDGRQIQLNMESSQFEERFRSWEKKLFGNNMLRLLSPSPDSRSHEEKQIKLQEIADEAFRLRLNFRDLSSADELRIKDVPALFEEYKLLVKLGNAGPRLLGGFRLKSVDALSASSSSPAGEIACSLWADEGESAYRKAPGLQSQSSGLLGAFVLDSVRQGKLNLLLKQLSNTRELQDVLWFLFHPKGMELEENEGKKFAEDYNHVFAALSLVEERNYSVVSLVKPVSEPGSDVDPRDCKGAEVKQTYQGKDTNSSKVTVGLVEPLKAQELPLSLGDSREVALPERVEKVLVASFLRVEVYLGEQVHQIP